METSNEAGLHHLLLFSLFSLFSNAVLPVLRVRTAAGGSSRSSLFSLNQAIKHSSNQAHKPHHEANSILPSFFAPFCVWPRSLPNLNPSPRPSCRRLVLAPRSSPRHRAYFQSSSLSSSSSFHSPHFVMPNKSASPPSQEPSRQATSSHMMKTTKRGRPFLKVLTIYPCSLSLAIPCLPQTRSNPGHTRPLRNSHRLSRLDHSQAVLSHILKLVHNVRERLLLRLLSSFRQMLIPPSPQR